MYIPNAFLESDPNILKEFIEENPFATLITSSESEPKVSHIPMYYLEKEGKRFLVGHVAKANNHWQDLKGKSTAIFHGPHAYVSSKWYESPNVVPTWNYVAVHVSGQVSKVNEKELHFIIDLMIQRHEGNIQAFQSHLNEEVRGQLEKHIVGLELEIEKMEGKWKVSQNKDINSQQKILSKLIETGDWGSIQIAKIMEENIQKSKR
jgi:transcriptional regulator